MKKLFLFLAAMLFSIGLWAEVGEVYYTFTPQKPSSGAVSDYTKTGTQTIDGMTWTVPGNQYATGALRLGGKSITNEDRVITGQSAMGDAIAKIVITHAGVTSDKLEVNSITVTAASDKDFTEDTVVKTLTSGTDFTIAKGVEDSIEFTLTDSYWAKDLYYKFAFNITNSNSSNYAWVLSSIKFYSYVAGDDDEEEEPTEQTLYLTLSDDWAGWPAKYAVYYFDDEAGTNGWSDFMTEVEDETNIYTSVIPVGYSDVIFVRLNSTATAPNWDDKWSQTVNLVIPTDGKNLFTVTSGGTGSECTGVWTKYPVVPTYYVAGSMTEWADEMVEMTEGSYTFEGLEAGKYEIKVVDNLGNWLGYDKLNTAASNTNIYGEGTGNIKFVLSEEGNVTVAYDGSKITITGSTIVAPTTVFTVTVPEGTEKAFIAGNFNSWTPTEMTAKEGEEDVFTYTFAGDIADTASYKYLAGDKWDYVEVNADDSEADNRGYAEADEVAKWKAVPVANKYVKVTAAPINWTGHYIITFADMKPHTAISGNDFIAAADAPTLVDVNDTITVAEGYDVDIRFSETAGAYNIQLPDGKYIKIPGSNAVNEADDAMALYIGYFAGSNQTGVQIADKADLTATGTRMVYANNTNYRSYTNKIDNSGYKLPTLYRKVDEAFDCADGPYNILVNGNTLVETIQGEELDGYTQYVAYLSLEKDDSIQIINSSCGAAWMPTIEDGGMSEHFTMGVNAATIDTTGCFDLYIKMKSGDDKLYIGAGVCADDTIRYYIVGDSAVMGSWDPATVGAKSDTYVFKDLAAGEYKFRLSLDGTWDNTIGFSDLTEVADGLSEGDDNNIIFTLKEAGDVTVVYNDSVFTVSGNFFYEVPVYADFNLVPGVWAEADAKMAAWIWGENLSGEWTNFFAGEGDTLTAQVNEKADYIIFVRFNGETQEPRWPGDNETNVIWNRIDTDSIDFVGRTFTVTDWGEDIYSVGTWDVYVPEVPAKYYITGDSALVVAAGVDKDHEWWANAIKVEQDTFVFVDMPAGTYAMKVVPEGTWEGSVAGFDQLTEAADGLSTDNDRNIIFTLAEAGDVTVVYNDSVFTVSGNFFYEVPEPEDSVTIYFVNTVEWEAVYAYAYTEDDEGVIQNAQWPGEAMLSTDEQANGFDVYAYKFPAKYVTIIFNNNDGEQTANLIWDEDTPFFYNNSWYASLDAIPALEADITISFVDTKNWGSVNVHLWNGITLEGTSWPGVEMTKSDEQVQGYDIYTYTFSAAIGYNMCIFNRVPDQTDDLEIHDGMIYCDSLWYSSLDEIPEIVNDEPIIDPTTTDFFIKHAGNGWTWAQMTYNEDEDKYTYVDIWGESGANLNTMSSDEGSVWYPMDYVAGADEVSLGDTVRFEYNYITKALNVVLVAEYVAPELPDDGYYIAGSMTDWADGMVALTGDDLTATIALAENEYNYYEFKVVRVVEGEQIWYGVRNWAEMTYGSSTDWNIYTGNDEYNIGLQMTKAGDYVFTVVVEEDHLSVSVVMPEPDPIQQSQYGLMIDEQFVAANINPANESELMVVGQVLEIGQTIQLYDATYEAGWVIENYNSDDSYRFVVEDGKYVVTEAGTYDFYFHLEQDADYIFVAKQTAINLEDVKAAEGKMMFNVLGQPVDETYRGIIIMKGKKSLKL